MYYKQKVARVLCPLSQVFVPLENDKQVHRRNFKAVLYPGKPRNLESLKSCPDLFGKVMIKELFHSR